MRDAKLIVNIYFSKHKIILSIYKNRCYSLIKATQDWHLQNFSFITLSYFSSYRLLWVFYKKFLGISRSFFALKTFFSNPPSRIWMEEESDKIPLGQNPSSVRIFLQFEL